MNYYFAPLEGITNLLYHRAHRSCFPSLNCYMTPFFTPSERGLSAKDRQILTRYQDESVPVVPQLLTKSAEDVVASARQLQDMGFHSLNLNFGCPSGTVVSKGRGAGILVDLDALRRLLDEICSASPLGISIKTRIGFSHPDEWDALLSVYRTYPLTELIVHPRVQAEHYRGKIHREAIDLALSQENIPLVYSGDLFTPDQVASWAKDYPSLKGIMLGRGLIANPALHATVTQNQPLTLARLHAFHNLLYDGYRDTLSGDQHLLHKMKELWHYMICLFANSEKLAKRLRKCQKREEFEDCVLRIFQSLSLYPQGGFCPPHERSTVS